MGHHHRRTTTTPGVIQMTNPDIKWFDHLEARYQDEKDYEPFTDYINAAKKRFGTRFLKLQAEPFALFLKGETFSIKDGQIYHEKEN